MQPWRAALALTHDNRLYLPHSLRRLVLAVRVRTHGGLALYEADTCQQRACSLVLRYPFALMLPWHCMMLTPATNSYVWYSFMHVPPSHCMITSTCRRVCASTHTPWRAAYIYTGAAYTASPLGAACAAAPPRRRIRVRPACRRARIHACEQLCAVSMMCRVCIWVQHVLLLLHDDPAGYVLFVAVHAYTHASSCVLSP